MTKLQIHFPFGFVISGQCLVALPLSYLVRLRKDWISRLETRPPMEHLQKKYNFSESSTLPGYSVGNTDIRIFFLIHFPYLLCESTRSDDGMNTKQNSVAKENVEYFCRIKTKKFTPPNIHSFDKKDTACGPSTATKTKVSSSSTKSKCKGLTQKQRDILEVLKDDPAIRQIFFEKLLDNDVADDNSSSAESATKPIIEDLQDSQDPYDL